MLKCLFLGLQCQVFLFFDLQMGGLKDMDLFFVTQGNKGSCLEGNVLLSVRCNAMSCDVFFFGMYWAVEGEC